MDVAVNLLAIVRAFAAIAMVSLTAGCVTELVSKPVGNASSAGMTYALPMTQYGIAVTRTLTACPEGDASRSFTLNFAATISEASVADPDHTYVIDYSEMSSGAKVSRLEIETYPNGTLKSINASADDRTEEVATGVVAAAGKIALAVVGVPPVSLPKERAEDPQLYDVSVECREDVASALAALSTSESGLRRAKRAVQASEAKVERVRLRIAASAEPTQADRQALSDAVDQLAAAREELQSILDARAPSVARITSVMGPLEWPKNGSTEDGAREELDSGAKLLNRWFSFATQPFDGRDSPSACARSDAGAAVACAKQEMAALLSVAVSLRRLTDVSSNGEQPENGSRPSGVYYRHSVPAVLELWHNVEDRADPAGAAIPKAFETNRGRVPQLGPLMVLPFSNGMFQDNVLQVAFDRSGQPTNLTYKEQSAPLEGAVAVLGEAAETARQVRQEVQLSELRRLQLEQAIIEGRQGVFDAEQNLALSRELSAVAGENQRLQAEVALLQQRSEVREIQELLAPDLLADQTEDVQAQVALVSAQQELLKAQIELERLRLEATSPTPGNS